MSAYLKASTRDRVCSVVLAALKEGTLPAKDHLERLVSEAAESSEKRTEIISIRLSEREARIVAAQAKEQNVSVPWLIRSRLFPQRKRFLPSPVELTDVE